jgi:hypothetical protein
MVRRFLALALVLLPLPALAQGLPQPPCGQPAEPAFGRPGGPPVARLWSEAELARWLPPSCLGWKVPRSRMAAAIAGEFAFAGTLDALLDRLGDFSRYRSISYWSTTRGTWEPLVSDAGLVGSADGRREVRGRDLEPGASFSYFEEGRAGRTVHSLTVLEREADRIVVGMANKTAIRLGPLSLFDPGALQTVLFLESRGNGRWAYYEVVRAGEGTSSLALNSPQSYVNRMMAFFAFLSGQPPSRAG